MGVSVARAPFQVLVFPFFRTDGHPAEYAIFRRADAGYWQAIAGGGEDVESPIEAARRETQEEAGIAPTCRFIQLDSMATVPAPEVAGFLWGAGTLVLPEYCFGVEVPHKDIQLSGEHSEARWLLYEDARRLLKWDSNRNALWELDHRLRAKGGTDEIMS